MKRGTTICLLILLPLLSVGLLLFTVITIVGEAFQAGMNLTYTTSDSDLMLTVSFSASVVLAIWWICLLVSVMRKRSRAKKDEAVVQEVHEAEELAPLSPETSSVGTALRRGFWSTVIIVSLTLGLALAAAHGPKLEGNVTTLSFNRFGSAPSPVIQMDRPPDTPEKFWKRFVLGGVIGWMLGFGLHGTIIKKFEDDFTPW